MVPSPSEFRERPRIADDRDGQLGSRVRENPANALRRAAAQERASRYLEMVDQGKTFKQIADDEGISRRTVKNVVQRERRSRGTELGPGTAAD